MPVEFLSDEQVAAYGRFSGELSAGDVERFFYLDDADRNLIARRRLDHHRLGFAVQLGTVRAVGRFLEDPLDVPWPAVEFLADQLAIGDASCVKKYVQRSQTPYEHAWEIRDRYGYRSFDDQSCAEAFVRFLDGRAWTHAEGPVALFEHATGWLRRNRVLLPGVTVLARQVASALARLGEPKRTATLVAVVRHLEAVAVDDTLDLFALLMTTRLFSPARRASAEQRLAMLPRLEKASKMVARAGRVLLDLLAAAEGPGGRLDVAALWTAIENVAPRAVVVEAIGLVEELVPDDDGSADSAMRAALAGRYNTVRPFLALLGESTALHAAPGGERVLAAVRALPELARRRVAQKPLTDAEIDAELVTRAWRRAVFANADLPAGGVDRDAYVMCVLEGLHRPLGRSAGAAARR